MTPSAFFQLRFHHSRTVAPPQSLGVAGGGVGGVGLLSQNAWSLQPVIESRTYFLMKDRGKEVIFSEVIEELEQE